MTFTYKIFLSIFQLSLHDLQVKYLSNYIEDFKKLAPCYILPLFTKINNSLYAIFYDIYQEIGA